MSTATIAPTGTWTVDTAHSAVGFAVKHLGIATVRGEFGDFEGTLVLGDELGSSRISGTVQTGSVDTGEQGRDDHLRSADFFDAETNPQIGFESTSIQREDDDTLRVTGNLTIHGITNEEVFLAEVQGTETDPWDNERVGLEVTGEISRGDYGMKFNQALGSGNTLVSDRVKIVLDISAVRSA